MRVLHHAIATGRCSQSQRRAARRPAARRATRQTTPPGFLYDTNIVSYLYKIVKPKKLVAQRRGRRGQGLPPVLPVAAASRTQLTAGAATFSSLRRHSAFV